MRITKLIINNFRAFKRAEIAFDDFNCIIGKNDTGKSTILAALEWFFNQNGELSENDFAAAGFDWYEHQSSLCYGETTGETYQGECFKEFIYDNFCISVEIYFSDAIIRNRTEECDFIFSKDFVSEDGNICIKKYMYHPNIDRYPPSNRNQMGYSIKAQYFEKLKKALSYCTFEELKTAYNEIGKSADKLCKRLNQLEGKHQNIKGRGIRAVAINTEIRDEILRIKEQMCSELYNYYNSIGEIASNEQWMCFDNIDQIESRLGLALPKYILYTSKTPINEYLNLLFTPFNANKVYKCIEEAKVYTAKKLSEHLSLDSTSEHLYIKENERINLFTQNSLVFRQNDLPLNISLKNRGEGLQLKIKNAVFRLLTEINTKNLTKTILAFEEPETHLHPSAQIEMYETIKTLSENSRYQVIITTHSPFIVKELARSGRLPIVVRREEQSQESKISKLDESVLPYISMNEINYIAFEEPSVEYHQELFAFLQGGEQTVDQVDNMFEKEYDWFQVDNKGKLVTIEGSPIEKRHSLPYCVRNQIDHPVVDDANDEKKHNAYITNRHFNEKELIRKSIKMMRDTIINNKKFC